MTSIRDKLAQKKTKLAAPKDKAETFQDLIGNYQEGSFYNVGIDRINTNPYQPRQYFDSEALDELSQSIKEKGVLQPIVIRRDKDGSIFLVAGERRLRAAKQAGLEKIPAILTKGNPIEISLIENLQREDLKPIEEAEALGRMIDEYHYTQEQLALAIGKARTTITETLSLRKLPEEMKNECRRADNYPRRLLVEIAKQKTPEAMAVLLNKVKEGNLKSDQVRDLTRKRTKTAHQTPTAIATERVLKLSRLLAKVDFEMAEKDEKDRLLAELRYLRGVIDTLVGLDE